jgi:hypothetical protein
MKEETKPTAESYCEVMIEKLYSELIDLQSKRIPEETLNKKIHLKFIEEAKIEYENYCFLKNISKYLSYKCPGTFMITGKNVLICARDLKARKIQSKIYESKFIKITHKQLMGIIYGGIKEEEDIFKKKTKKKAKVKKQEQKQLDFEIDVLPLFELWPHKDGIRIEYKNEKQTLKPIYILKSTSEFFIISNVWCWDNLSMKFVRITNNLLWDIYFHEKLYNKSINTGRLINEIEAKLASPVDEEPPTDQ